MDLLGSILRIIAMLGLVLATNVERNGEAQLLNRRS
jgi:hypothetical protein